MTAATGLRSRNRHRNRAVTKPMVRPLPLLRWDGEAPRSMIRIEAETVWSWGSTMALLSDSPASSGAGSIE